VLTEKEGRWLVKPGCSPPFETVAQSWFVLPPLMAYYYQLAHADYKPLPPLFPDCEAESRENMEFSYPPAHTTLFVPRNFTGEVRPAIFVVVHQQPGLKVHWHLNDKYLGSTTGPEHRMSIPASAGEYVVTAMDENGEKVSRKVRFVNPSASKH
ncbi:MAG TPA: hypothetical protein PKE03_10480, partial [Bacteroidales bacterium]|nr:hypothetical protein [Bacteroidales bacterium]